MNSKDYWQLFMETGAPEAYLMYASQLKMEEQHVFNRPGHRPQGNRLQ